MKRVAWVIIAIVSLIVTARSQDKDSLLLQLYNTGLITKEIYYKSRPIAEVMKEGNQVVQKLRSQLTYKFAVDYLIEHSDTESIRAWALYSDSIKCVHPDDPGVLEEFKLPTDYKLYQYHSFDNKDTYYLLGEFIPGFYGFYLFSTDSVPPVYCDKVELPRDGRFEFGTLNGGSIIKYYYPTWGTGYFKKHFDIGAIDNNRFHLLYETTLAAEAEPPWSEFPERALTTIKYTDINGDGYLDIVEESVVDSLADLSQNAFQDNTIESLRSLKTIKRVSRTLLWDPARSTFIEQNQQKP